jgi:SpoVK/Ycf46/Vps4 family AAA+-type ATPase
VLPMTHKERFEALGIQPPKGIALLKMNEWKNEQMKANIYLEYMHAHRPVLSFQF